MPPNYKRIYLDIIQTKFPEKKILCDKFFFKTALSTLDIIELDNIIFGNFEKKTIFFNQSHKSFDKKSIMKILIYQKKNRLSNSQVATHFNLSRNTITAWKKSLCELTKNHFQ
jgi:DNA-binding transcriptional regulator YiaG